MAEKPDAKGKTKKKDAAPMGHNITEIRKKAEPAFKEILKKFADMESDMGSYRAEIKDLYDKHAGAIGISKKLLRQEVAKLRAAQRHEALEQEMEADEREQVETLRAALEGTPFGVYLSDKLAKPVKEK